MAEPFYDVIIMGGGPAGSSLAARLARETALRVAVFEEETFPREHIGESFASPAVPCLQESGVLPQVLASDCHIRKFGGYYAWGGEAPAVSFFRHRLWQGDGVHRWSMHVNRAEFDHVLLRHARQCGADVREGLRVKSVRRLRDRSQVQLAGGGDVECRIFVDASGRANAAGLDARKGWLSSYRNIAIWGHFTGGAAAQSLDGGWNLFRARNFSPIGCFAYEEGWCWYIPVRQTVDGRRIQTHSIGIVTDPKVVKRPGSKLRQMDGFRELIRGIPLLEQLIPDIRPVYSELRTATNYSMISGRMCDYEQQWLSVGDACFFVDPLFSSGVSFAMLQAAAASQLIKATLGRDLADAMKQELWDDYRETWSVAAWSFAMNIDQWYAAIAHENPDSVYWNERASNQAFYDRLNSFDWLLDTDFSGDLVYVMSRGGNDLRTLAPNGPLMQALSRLASSDPAPDARIRLRRGVSARRSITLGSCVTGGDRPSAGAPNPWVHGPYWDDPDAHAQEVAAIFSEPTECYRFGADGEGPRVRFFDPDCLAMARLLGEESCGFGELRERLSPSQWRTLTRLLVAGMAEAEQAA